jgi:hypothetical protein
MGCENKPSIQIRSCVREMGMNGSKILSELYNVELRRVKSERYIAITPVFLNYVGTA